jgi:organic radical activating enzyme
MFSSIQGEGNFLGVPATFIRFVGCNLKCSFCDTKKTWEGKPEGINLTIEEIVTRAISMDNTLIVITGGEPCLQKDLQELIDQLRLRNFVVAIETNGTMATPITDWVTCSPKEDAGYVINSLCHPNELKYVVTPDFIAEAAIPQGIREIYAGKIWLQPEGSQMKEMWKKCFALAMADPRLRVGVQLHKLMEVE